jgi:hypothetical protein
MTGMLDSEIIGLRVRRVEMKEVYPNITENIIDKPV